MTDLEISKALALAIGWTEDRVVLGYSDPDILIQDDKVFVWFCRAWAPFDYRDPAVIWPIAERYNCFPFRQCARSGRFTGQWVAWYEQRTDGLADTASKAVALAVIGGAK